ncbi:MAG TPA: PRC-barrel domain-containing protein [Terriglobales bacterium]|nr:PRC-barrel domain-containing protein [Terriglobales bacterium]
MAHYRTLRDFKLPVAADVRGTAVYGLEDEKIGKLDDVILDHSTGDVKYAVVDSGGWLKSHKFLVPADRMFPYAKRPGDFVVGVTRQQIKEFPAYNEKTLESQDEWKKYRDSYDKGWQDRPVQHHHASDRDITPPETPGAPSSAAPADRELDAADLYPEPIHDKFSSAMPSGGKLTEHPSGTIDRAQNAAYGDDPLGSRWSAFQEHLRRNRVDIQASCPQCAPAPEKKRDVA